MTVERILQIAKAQDRRVVPQKVAVTSTTEGDRRKVAEAARKVIDTHWDTLVALKNL